MRGIAVAGDRGLADPALGRDRGQGRTRTVIRPLRALAALTLAIAPGFLLGAEPARATAATAPAAAAQSSAGLLRLVSQTAVVEPDGAFELRVRAVGAPAGAKIRWTVHDRVSNRSEFTRSIEGEGLRRALSTSPATELAALLPDADQTVTLTIPIRSSASGSPDRLRVPSQGVYPVEVELLDRSDERLDRFVTHLVRLPTSDDDITRLSVAIVLPIDSGPSLQPDGATRLSGQVRGGVANALAALVSHAATPATLIPTPEVIDALARQTGPSDASILASLRQAVVGRQVLASPYVPINLSAFSDHGLESELDAQWDTGIDVVSQHLTRPDRRTWLLTEPASANALKRLGDRGVEQLVVAESALAPLDGRRFPRTLTRTFEIAAGEQKLRAAMADGSLAAHLDESGDPVLDAQRVLADLATLYFDEPASARGAVLAVPPGWTPQVEFLDAVFSGLSGNPLMAPVTLDTFFHDVPTIGSRGETSGVSKPLVRPITAPSPDDLASLPTNLAAASGRVATFASAVGPDDARLDRLRKRLLIAGSDTLTASKRNQYADAVEHEIAATFGKVSVPQRQTITFTSRTGQLTLVIRNETGQPLNVDVLLQSDKLELPGEPDGRIRVPLTEETTRLDLAVRARASGDSALDVTVLTPDGHVELGRTRFTVRSTAVSGVGAVLSGGAIAFLLLWWGRSWRRSRRTTAPAGPASPAPST